VSETVPVAAKDVTPVAAQSVATQATLLTPDEFSKVLYREVTVQRVPIQYKEIQVEDLKRMLKLCSAIAKDLSETLKLVDANILYRISAGLQDYSGADKATFLEIFETAPKVSSITIGIAASYNPDRNLYMRSAELRATSDLAQSSQITVAGDESMWVKSVHALFSQAVSELGSANKFLYLDITEFVLQITAVLLVFALSAISANLSEIRSLPVSQVYVFAGVFLLGSNVWTFLSRVLFAQRAKLFPPIAFKRPKAEFYVKTAATAVLLFIICWAGNTSLDFIKGKLTAKSPSADQKTATQSSSAP
jgi:hypothetical protein